MISTGLGAEEIWQLLGGERSGSPAGRGTSRGGASRRLDGSHGCEIPRRSWLNQRGFIHDYTRDEKLPFKKFGFLIIQEENP